MRRILLLPLFLVLSTAGAPYAAQEALTFGRFGTVVVYRESPHPSHVALFVSGDEAEVSPFIPPAADTQETKKTIPDCASLPSPA